MDRYFNYPPNLPATWPRMTYEEFMAWSDEDTWAEWVAGEVVPWERMTLTHQELLGWMSMVLGFYAQARDLGKVLPLVGVHLPSRPSLRLPDVVFVAHAHRNRLTPTVIEGPADLVIEIVSDDGVRRDQIEKRDEYAAAGVPEYWWLDPRPRHQATRFYRLIEEGRYVKIQPDAAGRYHSGVVPGFWLDPAWLWPDSLPDPVQLMAAIAPQAWRDSIVGHGSGQNAVPNADDADL